MIGRIHAVIIRVIDFMRKPRKSPSEDVLRKLESEIDRLSPPAVETMIEWLKAVQTTISRNHTESMQVMSDISDKTAALTQAVTDNTTAVNAAVAKIGTGSSPSDAADVAAAVTAIDAATTQIEANTATLNNAAPQPA